MSLCRGRNVAMRCTAGTARFGLSSLQTPLVLPGPGSTFGAYGLQAADLAWAPNAARKAAIDALYAQAQDVALGDAYTQAQRSAFLEHYPERKGR